MKIKHYQDTGEAEICFSWKEIWTLIKHQKLKLSEDVVALAFEVVACVIVSPV